MYLNEKSWKVQQDEPYLIDGAIRKFLDIYAAIKRKYPRLEIYVPENETIILQSTKYPFEKWLATVDREYQRLYLSFWQKRITYSPEDEYEIAFEGEELRGGTEAYLNDSFMISIGLTDKWKQELVVGELTALRNDDERTVKVKNIFFKEQLENKQIIDIFQKETGIRVCSYPELWRRRKDFFPHLSFCPSVENNLNILENFYLNQIVKKLIELENYCNNYVDKRFDASLLTKTTIESRSTIDKYNMEHTFIDETGASHVASWHMRFTGIPGRIFFIPEYSENSMLICYIGKKLKNVTYPT